MTHHKFLVSTLRKFEPPSPTDFMYSLLDANTTWHRFSLMYNLSTRGLGLQQGGVGLPADFEEMYIQHRLATIESVIEDSSSGNLSFTTLTIMRGMSMCDVGFPSCGCSTSICSSTRYLALALSTAS
jgi:hypothetical protein